jgi:UDP-N-acetylglucosamine--N-acetylmuramyl-(pentapeptide) pyrophosphoryl-undecaprenol N-acetylglucosamine transferase
VSSASSPRILLAAGGTGGHLFPAEALAVELVKSGIEIHLATDQRGMAYGGAFPAKERHAIRAATPSGKSPVAMAKALLSLGIGFFQSLRLVHRLKPDAVVGFGGYPSVPPVLAAWLMGIPTLVHEQNGVLGRANRFLAPRAKIVGTGFADVKDVSPSFHDRIHLVGNPVRPVVLEAARQPYHPIVSDGPIHLLVTGGSQGARVMSEVVPKALGLLPPVLKARLAIVHQARGNDLATAEQLYTEAGIKADIRAFFDDLPQRIADAHLVIGRAGASTVAELAVIGRPSILVPLPGSLDQDQAANADSLARIGAAKVLRQRDFTPEALATLLERLFTHPSELTDSSLAAKSAGIPDAAARFADLVVLTAGLDVKRSVLP